MVWPSPALSSILMVRLFGRVHVVLYVRFGIPLVFWSDPDPNIRYTGTKMYYVIIVLFFLPVDGNIFTE